MREVPQNLADGQAGVYRVAAELLLRGINVHFPSVDVGADLITDGGLRIQVKTAHLTMRGAYGKSGGAYWFGFRKGPIVVSCHTVQKRGTRKFSDECDFVILAGIEQNRYWIVPSAVLDGRFMVAVGQSRVIDRVDSLTKTVSLNENRWDLIQGCVDTMRGVESVQVDAVLA